MVGSFFEEGHEALPCTGLFDISFKAVGSFFEGVDKPRARDKPRAGINPAHTKGKWRNSYDYNEFCIKRRSHKKAGETCSTA